MNLFSRRSTSFKRKAWAPAVAATLSVLIGVLPLATSQLQARTTSNENPELTIYNHNFALVKDYQTLNLKVGKNHIELDSVAALIDPTSVNLKSITAPQAVSVDEQNFRYDLINKANILDQMVGKSIRFRKDDVVQEGILLNPVTNYVRRNYSGYGSNNYSKQNTQSFAIKTSDGILLTTLDDIIIDKLPEGLYPRPTLVWDLYSDKAGSHKTEVSYLTDGIKWSTDYVAVVSDNDDRLDITGWVSLDNQSGTTYPQAKLKLVAGEVRKLQNHGGGRDYAEDMMVMKSSAPRAARNEFKEESLFEYHLYTLNNPTTVRNNETKQLALVTAQSVPVKKQYLFDPGRSVYYSWRSSGRHYKPGRSSDTKQVKINTILTLKNSKSNNLGVPMPKGKVRVSKKDSSGSLQFIGEDWVDHTPVDENIDLYLGDAFDIVGERKRTSYSKTGNGHEETYTVTLRNHKKSAITVDVIDHFYGDWKLTNNSHKFSKEDAQTIKMPVKVGAGGQANVTYTVKVTNR